MLSSVLALILLTILNRCCYLVLSMVGVVGTTTHVIYIINTYITTRGIAPAKDHISECLPRTKEHTKYYVQNFDSKVL